MASQNQINSAMRRAKKHFGDCCLISFTESPDGAHIFPRSTHPHLSAVQFNIVPLARHLHRQMDEHSRAADRIVWLRQHVKGESRALLNGWLLELLQTIAEAA